ncbi:MAG TPA: PEP-CTERM sorting domain-containing protein [Rhodopila sp.]|nr:PEP-CTERM sorting domain-containing protein [Rhodopila sp.]
MSDVWKYASSGIALLAVLGVAGPACAQTVALSTSSATQIVAGTIYQFGDTTFSFTCTTGCSSLALLGVTNGDGSEIEIEGNPPSSVIFSGAAGGTQYGNTLGITVGQITGSKGISSVTNIVSGSLAVSGDTADENLVSSGLSSFSNPLTNVSPASATSNLSTPLTTVSFNNSLSSFSFDDQLLDSTGSGKPNDALTLTNVALLFQPAPEPASIALFATGLIGLTAARRRFSRCAKRKAATAHC